MYPEPKLITPLGKGTLHIMSRPTGGKCLAEDLDLLAKCGIDCIVSLLEPWEISALQLDLQPQLCAERAMQYFNFPIPDRCAPIDKVAFIGLVHRTREAILQGADCLAHCRAGIGRSGIFTSSILIAHGVGAADAFQLVSKARGCKIPDTQIQIDWVHANEAELARLA